MKYTDKELAEIEATKREIDHVKQAIQSEWWDDTMKALESEMWATIDELKTCQWDLANLARICGKIYGLRAIMTDHEAVLGLEETIREIDEE